MSESRKHVLLWVSSEFLQSEGIIQILKEAGLFPAAEKDDDRLFESAEQIAGFALTGWLVDTHHGAGIWIAPVQSPELEMMIPWNMVRTVITAEEKENRLFGLANLRGPRLKVPAVESKTE